jgi:excisionase family DNA binding protein
MERLLTTAGVAAILDVCARSVERYTAQGLLPAHKLGKRVLYSPNEVTAFLERSRT